MKNQPHCEIKHNKTQSQGTLNGFLFLYQLREGDQRAIGMSLVSFSIIKIIIVKIIIAKG